MGRTITLIPGEVTIITAGGKITMIMEEVMTEMVIIMIGAVTITVEAVAGIAGAIEIRTEEDTVQVEGASDAMGIRLVVARAVNEGMGILPALLANEGMGILQVPPVSAGMVIHLRKTTTLMTRSLPITPKEIPTAKEILILITKEREVGRITAVVFSVVKEVTRVTRAANQVLKSANPERELHFKMP
jgi:hypothetical protein